MDNTRPLILISNDDGYDYEGIQELIKIAQTFADIAVVCPHRHQSGKSGAITITRPLKTNVISNTPQLTIITVDGTPADCVKLALDKLVTGRRPDLMLSGINHGYNAGIYSNYSGTMGAAREAVVHGVPAIAISHENLQRELHLGPQLRQLIEKIIRWGLESPPPKGVCLNINLPSDAEQPVQGIRQTVSTIGRWTREYEHRVSPFGEDYYWLVGEFHPDNPDDDRTDIYWLKRRWATITPLRIDPTADVTLDINTLQ